MRAIDRKVAADANPGAESVDSGNEAASWTETSGDWESVASVGGDFPINSAKEGSGFFYQQGAVADAVHEQSVQLYKVPDADIDGGNLEADLSVWQAHNYAEDPRLARSDDQQRAGACRPCQTRRGAR